MASSEEKPKKWTKKSGKQFNGIAKEIFGPIYPVLADEFVRRSGITKGVCIDLGSGPGHLGIALARSYNFKVYGVDFSEEIRNVACENVAKENLVGSVEPTLCGVDNMPFEDNFADLIISRGSVFFWDNIEAAFREIHRVLKPGGRTYIGGGFGNAQLKEEISAKMKEANPEWDCPGHKPPAQARLDRARAFMKENGITFQDTNDDSGQWLEMSK